MTRFLDTLFHAMCIKVMALSEDPRAHARARGANNAHSWVLCMIGSTQVPKVNFGFELPSAHMPTKLAFAQCLDQTTKLFEATFGFDARNGWDQVRDKDIPTNEAFGFYDGLHTLAERFELWELLNRQPQEEPKSPITVVRTTRMKAGECNFCHSQDPEVYEVRSNDPYCTLMVRICKVCVTAFRAQTRRV